MLPGIHHLIQRRLDDHLTILLYHTIEPKLFEKHLTYLKEKYSILPLSSIINKKESMPKYPLIITFDDGWVSNHELIPILEKHKVKVAVFLTAALIDTNRKIWNTVIRDKNPTRNEELKKFSNKEKNKILLEEFGYNIEDEFAERTMLSSKEIHEMLSWVDFQSHGMNHSVLTKCEDEELQYELAESKYKIEFITGKSVLAIAYPYNKVTERERTAAISTGYLIGRAGSGQLNKPSQDLMMLKSIPINKNTSLSKLKVILAQAKLRTLLFPGR
jgi:peptidoglycan/xylan/chitin deacetylase (PgdA/CDA1 family)